MEKHSRQQDEPDITFPAREAEYPNHDNALVISVKIAKIDNGRHRELGRRPVPRCLLEARLNKKKDLVPMALTLTGFTGDSISPLGTTTLSVTIGKEPRSKTMMVIFMVVGLPSAYNVILGRLTLNKLRVVISTYHWAIKFPTHVGIGEVRSDPWESR